MREDAEKAHGLLARGRLNHVLGMILLIVALALGAMLDPWTFAAHPDAQTALLAREIQLALLRAGFLQLFIGAFLMALPRSRSVLAVAVLVTIVGVIATITAHVLGLFWQGRGYLVTGGALTCLGGLTVIAIAAQGQARRFHSQLLAVTAGGLILEAIHGLALGNDAVLNLGAADALPLRLLRLACMAAVALPLLAVLLDGLVRRAQPVGRTQYWSRVAIIIGTFGLPASLVAATFIDIRLKYLLPPFADALLIGVVLGWWQARRLAAPFEAWGWALLSASMTAGLLMGGYAFDGPLEPPRFLGEYIDVERQISRVIHVYTMVFGFVLIIAARTPGMERGMSADRHTRTLLLAAITMPTALLLQAVFGLPAFVLAVGPAILLLAAAHWTTAYLAPTTPLKEGD